VFSHIKYKAWCPVFYVFIALHNCSKENKNYIVCSSHSQKKYTCRMLLDGSNMCGSIVQMSNIWISWREGVSHLQKNARSCIVRAVTSSCCFSDVVFMDFLLRNTQYKVIYFICSMKLRGVDISRYYHKHNIESCSFINIHYI